MPTYLITGANRGIGHALLKTYLLRPSHTLIATIRTPQTPTSDLLALPIHPTSTLHILPIDFSSPTSPSTALNQLITAHSITTIDVVIANAGIMSPTAFGPLATLTADEIKSHVDVNAIGPLMLFQAVLPLLRKQCSSPSATLEPAGKFITISSPAGSISGMDAFPWPFPAYGTSKAMLNYFTRKMHFECEDLVVFAMDPGFVQTAMGNAGAAYFGMREASTPLETSVQGLARVIDGASREETSGRFVDFEGNEVPW